MIRWQEMRMDMIVDNIHHSVYIAHHYHNIFLQSFTTSRCETFVKLSCASEAKVEQKKNWRYYFDSSVSVLFDDGNPFEYADFWILVSSQVWAYIYIFLLTTFMILIYGDEAIS